MLAEGEAGFSAGGTRGWGDLVGRQGIFTGASLQPEGSWMLAGTRLELVAVAISAVGGGETGGQARGGGRVGGSSRMC